MVAFWLFWVTIRGLESSLRTPLDSAAVMKKSSEKFAERCETPKPDVGEPALKDVCRGRPLVTPLPEAPPPLGKVTGFAGIPFPGVTPLPPTAGEPVKIDRPLLTVPAKPSSVPISCPNALDP